MSETKRDGAFTEDGRLHRGGRTGRRRLPLVGAARSRNGGSRGSGACDGRGPGTRAAGSAPEGPHTARPRGDGASPDVEGPSRPRAPRYSAADLRREVAEGLRYAHGRANGITGKLLDVTSFAYAAIELLADRGLLSVDELEARRKEIGGRLVEKFRADGMGAAYQDPEEDKYAFEETVEIDCASRVHLCKAACCRLRFALSRQDVEEGVVEWDFGHPYFIAHDESGYCRHLDREELRCTVHEQRPVPCRGYDCRDDDRIWADFEARIPSPRLAELFGGEPEAGRDVDDG